MESKNCRQVQLIGRLMAIESFEAVGMQKKRMDVIFEAINIARKLGYDASVRPLNVPVEEVKANPEYKTIPGQSNIVAYIVLPTGEVSYFLQLHTSPYEGYTRDEKMNRIRSYIDSCEAEM